MYCDRFEQVTYLHGHTMNPPEACGVFVFSSTDKPDYGKWTFRGTVATAAQFPDSGEGPNENVRECADQRKRQITSASAAGFACHTDWLQFRPDQSVCCDATLSVCWMLRYQAISLLADGSTLTVVFRLDNGDGDPLVNSLLLLFQSRWITVSTACCAILDVQCMSCSTHWTQSRHHITRASQPTVSVRTYECQTTRLIIITRERRHHAG